MKERLRRRQLSAPAGILTILVLFICIFLIAMIMFVLADAFNAPWLQYVEYVLFIIIGVLIIRFWVTEYEYALVDDELFIDRWLGKRPRRLLSIELRDIIHIGDRLPEDYKGRKQRLTFKSKRRGVVYIIYRGGKNKKCVFFSPSKELLALIEKRRTKAKQPAQG